MVFTTQNFKTEVLDSETPVLVDFWAPWCGPCKVISPIVEELASDYQGKLKVGKLNVDDNPEVSQQYSIMSIPNLKIFKKGKIVGEVTGAVAKEIIARTIEVSLNA